MKWAAQSERSRAVGRLSAIVLAAALAVSLSACAGGTASSVGGQSASQQAAVSASQPAVSTSEAAVSVAQTVSAAQPSSAEAAGVSSAPSAAPPVVSPDESAVSQPQTDPVGRTITLTVHRGDEVTVFTATLVENSSADALLELLADGPLTLTMTDYGSFEKVGPLGHSLPRNDESITTAPGDLILYQGNSFVIYYAQNSWSFTRLGRINNATQQQLREALGEEGVTVTLALG